MSDIAKILGQPFDPTQQEASVAWEPLVPGWYNAFIEKEEIKETRARDGHLLNLWFSIIDGPYKNRKVFTNINLANPSAKCVAIGKADLTALTQSLNIPLLQDTAQLINGSVQIRVIIKKDQNEIKGYKPIGAVTTAVPVAPVPSIPADIAPAAPPAPVQPPVAPDRPPQPLAAFPACGTPAPITPVPPAAQPVVPPAVAPPVPGGPTPALIPPANPAVQYRDPASPPPAAAPAPMLPATGLDLEPWKR